MRRAGTAKVWAGLTAMLGIGAATVALAGSAAAGAPGPKDEYVSVGGAKLHLVVRPGKGPVVVFESGSGLDAGEWDKVIASLAPRTGAALVAYDREAHGGSDALTTPYDVHEEVVRLHKALYALGLDRDVVLVGHSYGGLLIQLYANVYPQDVRGMVYVDGSTLIGIGGVEAARKSTQDTLDALKTTVLTPEQSAAWKIEQRQLTAYGATVETLARNPAPCGVPITVISEGKGEVLAALPHWLEGHQALVARTGGKAVKAADSGHMIPLEAPTLVADEVLGRLQAAPSRDRRVWFVDPAVSCASGAPVSPPS